MVRDRCHLSSDGRLPRLLRVKCPTKGPATAKVLRSRCHSNVVHLAELLRLHKTTTSAFLPRDWMVRGHCLLCSGGHLARLLRLDSRIKRPGMALLPPRTQRSHRLLLDDQLQSLSNPNSRARTTILGYLLRVFERHTGSLRETPNLSFFLMFPLGLTCARNLVHELLRFLC